MLRLQCNAHWIRIWMADVCQLWHVDMAKQDGGLPSAEGVARNAPRKN